jgi:hypothetical protein
VIYGHRRSNPSGPLTRAFIEFFADDKTLWPALAKLKGGLQRFGTSIVGLGARIGALGAAIVLPLFAAAKAASTTASQFVGLSKMTGLSVEALSELAFAAGGVDELAMALKRTQLSLGQAEGGSKTAQKAFANLGVSWKELATVAPDEQLLRLSDAFAKIQDPARKTAMAQKLFGRSFAEILPFLQKGRAGINEMRQQLRDMGLTMSGEDAEAAKSFGKTLKLLSYAFKQIVFLVGSAVAPVFQDLFKSAFPVITVIVKWVKENRGLIVTLLKVGFVLVGVGTALTWLGGVFIGLGTVIGGVVGVLTALLSPLGLITTAVVGLGALLVYQSGGWEQLKDTAVSSWGGIRDALAAGNLGAAMNIAWLAIKLEWTKGINFLLDTWAHFKMDFMTILDGLATAIASKWVDVGALMESIWTRVMGKIGRTDVTAALAGIERRRFGMQAALSSIQARNQREREGAYDTGAAGRAGETADLQGQLDAAIAAAAEAAKKPLGAVPGAGETPAIPALGGAGGGGAAGGFNVAAAFGLGIGSELVNAAKRTADNTDRIAEALEDQDQGIPLG